MSLKEEKLLPTKIVFASFLSSRVSGYSCRTFDWPFIAFKAEAKEAMYVFL